MAHEWRTGSTKTKQNAISHTSTACTTTGCLIKAIQQRHAMSQSLQDTAWPGIYRVYHSMLHVVHPVSRCQSQFDVSHVPKCTRLSLPLIWEVDSGRYIPHFLLISCSGLFKCWFISTTSIYLWLPVIVHVPCVCVCVCVCVRARLWLDAP